MKAFGPQLKYARRQRGLTQEEVSGHLGVARSQLAHIERLERIPQHHVSKLDKLFEGVTWRTSLAHKAPAPSVYVSLAEFSKFQNRLFDLERRITGFFDLLDAAAKKGRKKRTGRAGKLGLHKGRMN